MFMIITMQVAKLLCARQMPGLRNNIRCVPLALLHCISCQSCYILEKAQCTNPSHKSGQCQQQVCECRAAGGLARVAKIMMTVQVLLLLLLLATF
jgi:hypothetical protein